MVSEQVLAGESQQAVSADREGIDFEIVDDTSAEQVEREQSLLSPGEQQQSASDPRSLPEPAPDLGTEPEPATDDTERPDLDSRRPRTYSQDEVSKMQAAWGRQIEAARRSEAAASEQLRKFNLDAATEALLRKQVAELTPKIGVERAEQAVRDPRNAELARRSIVSQHLLDRSEAEKARLMHEQEAQARFIVARTLAEEHEVAREDFDHLAAAPTPQAMQGLARRLGKRASDRVQDRVPPETSRTQLENGYHAGPAPENANRRLERIRATPSWEWTEADLRYMKTGEVR